MTAIWDYAATRVIMVIAHQQLVAWHNSLATIAMVNLGNEGLDRGEERSIAQKLMVVVSCIC